MATAGSVDIPDGDLIFDQHNVRILQEGSHRSAVHNGVLQLRLTPIGHVVCWCPQDNYNEHQPHDRQHHQHHQPQPHVNGGGTTAHQNGSGGGAGGPSANSDETWPAAGKGGANNEPPGPPAESQHCNDGSKPVVVKPRPNSFWFELREMRSYHLHPKKDCYELTIMLCDGTRLPTLVFDIGKQQTFLTTIAKEVRTRVSSKDKRLHLVVEDNVDALQKSFNSLDLFQLDGGDQNLVSRFVRDPLPTFADGLAKVTHFFTQAHQYPGSRQISEGMIELNPASFIDFEDTFTINVDQEPGFDFVEQVAELPSRIPVTRTAPLGIDEWTTFFDLEGRIVDPHNLRARIFRGGCCPEIRPEAWKFLLGVHDFSKAKRERDAENEQLNHDYYRMKLQWKSISSDQESRFSAFAARKSLVEKDVNRTDRSLDIFARDGNEYLSMLSDVLMTYIMYDFDLGYVQGMSDLLSPILSVMQNESDSFWCFVKFVSMIRCNFVDDDRMEEKDQRQLGIKRQLQQLHQLLSVALPSFAGYLDDHESGNLYFCFRWLLIWFKREFSFEDTKRLWEVLWTRLPCENFHLLFCVAILEEERVRITENNFGLNEILKHINDMCFKIALENNLIRAEQLYFQLLDIPKAASILGIHESAGQAS